MNCFSAIALISAVFVALASAATKEFKFTKKRIPANKYERRCEDDDANLTSLTLDENNMERIAKFMRKSYIHEAWVGNVKGINYDGAVLLKVNFDPKGKYDFHTFEIVPKGHAMKYSNEHYALCSRN